MTVGTIKAVGLVGIIWLYRIIRKIWQSTQTPDNWKNGIIVQIDKKKEARNCHN
jgi:hypothetical protein